MVFGATEIGTLIAVTVSILLLGLNMYAKSNDLGALSERHRKVAPELWRVREKYLGLITDLRIGRGPVEKLLAKRDELLEELYSIYSGAPSTDEQAYGKAQGTLGTGRMASNNQWAKPGAD